MEGNSSEVTGFDFIPVVHIKFRDVGFDRGISSFGHAIANIRECDRLATKLNDMLFPEVHWTLERDGTGPDGNPLPPIELETEEPEGSTNNGKGWARGYWKGEREADEGVVEVGRQRVTRLPAGGRLSPQIPDINFEAH
jgi:hypothetical protein